MEKKISPLSWGLLIGLAFIWGSSFILIKKSLIAFAPEQVACLRVGISALCLVPFMLRQARKIELSKIKYIAIAAFFGNLLPSFMFAIAQTKIDSALSGILNSMVPLFALSLGVLFFKVQSKWAKWIGVLIGLLGASLLILESMNFNSGENNWYAFLIVLGTLSYGMSANVIKTYLQDIPPLAITTLSFAIIGPPALIYLGFSDFSTVLQSHPQALFSLSMVSILAIIGTVFAQLLFIKLIQLTNAVFGSMVSYLIPIVAVLWGLQDKEIITPIQIAGLCLILSGVYLSSKKGNEI